MSLADFLTRPVAYHPALARVVGSVPAAVMLSQAIYWQKRVPQPRPPGCPGSDWWYHSIEEWEQETALGRDAQFSARKRLAGLLESRLAGQPARMWYRVNLFAVEKILQNQQLAALPHPSLRQCRKLDGRFAANKSAGLPQTSESTAEITTTTTTSLLSSNPEPQPPINASSGDNENEMEEYIFLAAKDYCLTQGFGEAKLAGVIHSIRKRLIEQHGMNDIDRQQLEALRAHQREVQDMRSRLAAQEEEEPPAGPTPGPNRGAEIIQFPGQPGDEPLTWQKAREHLRGALPGNIYSLWIAPLSCLSQDGNTLKLVGPDLYFCSWVKDNYLKEIKSALAIVGLAGARIRLTVAGL